MLSLSRLPEGANKCVSRAHAFKKVDYGRMTDPKLPSCFRVTRCFEASEENLPLPRRQVVADSL